MVHVLAADRLVVIQDQTTSAAEASKSFTRPARTTSGGACPASRSRRPPDDPVVSLLQRSDQVAQKPTRPVIVPVEGHPGQGQAHGRTREATKAVLPKPAGAIIRVSGPRRPRATRSCSRGRATSPDRVRAGVAWCGERVGLVHGVASADSARLMIATGSRLAQRPGYV